MTENEKYLYTHFLISIKSGFQSLEDITESALEMLEDEGWQSEISEEWIRTTICEEYSKNEIESKKWKRPTDTDRLHEVFDKLCHNKIIALHNAGYTMSEAAYDAQDVWKDLEAEGIKPVGYCFYHGQDLERVIETGTLCIGFSGERDKNEKEAIAVGHKVVQALEEAGFSVNWNCTASKRIEVRDFNWQNTFVSDEDVEAKWGYDRVFSLMEV